MRLVADGYNAPVTAGDFVDLVDRGFYDGMTIQRADGFIVQTGDPDGPVRCRYGPPISRPSGFTPSHDQAASLSVLQVLHGLRLGL